MDMGPMYVIVREDHIALHCNECYRYRSTISNPAYRIHVFSSPADVAEILALSEQHMREKHS